MPFDQYKVNLDTPQPGGRQGESPRSAFTKYNDFLDAVALGEIVVGPNPPTETRAYGEWINTSTVPPMLMRRNGDNTEWVTIAPALAALATLAGDNEFGGANSFTGDNEFGGANSFTGDNEFSGANSFTGDNEFSGANSFTGDNEFSGATLLASLLLGNADTEIARAAAGQIDVDGSRVYQRNNIVGTVSQSGGVPTGALVQYGSNENGEFWRYAGGMQICYLSISGQGYDISSSSYRTWTFPAPFVITPIPLVSVQRGASDTLGIYARFGGIRTSTQINVAHSGNSGAGLNFELFAIGTWHS